MLFALAQTARAEPETIPDDPALTTTESTTTTRSRSTYDWEAETDSQGVTIYPPPPDESASSGSTTSTERTSRTSTPFRVNPDHPDDVYTGALPQGNLPNFNQAATDIYGNPITLVITAPPTEETTTEEATATQEDTTEETIPEEQMARPFNWVVAWIAGGALVAAAAGGIAVFVKGRKDGDDDDYIYE